MFDNFLEDHILDSKFYAIFINGTHEGYLAVHEDNMLTQFYLPRRLLRQAQPVFAQALRELSVTCAYVPTCDELLLSLCLDKHARIEKQAYFFTDGGAPVRPPELPRSLLRLTSREEWASINENTEDFFDEIHQEKIKSGAVPYDIYALERDGQALGYGLREGARIFSDYDAVGMYVMPEHRQRGVGRSIILHLKDICAQNGQRALPGCWYYNDNSKRTLESAGFVTRTRLLKVFLNKEEKR